jgi:uncharacterized membrane protein
LSSGFLVETNAVRAEIRLQLSVIVMTGILAFLTVVMEGGTSIRWVFVVPSVLLVPPLVYAFSRLPLPPVHRLFWYLLLSYAVLHLAFEAVVYYTALRATLDTSAFVQSFWNFIHKGAFETTVDGQYSFVAPNALNHFARHNSPILFVPLAFYAIYPEMITLIIFKTVALAITGWLAMQLVYAMLPDARQKPITALLPFVLLLQVPLVLMTDFYETLFYPPLFLWSVLAFQRNQKWQFAVSCILFATIKEMTVPILLMWPVVALFKKRGMAFIVAPLLVAAATFVISFFVIIPHFNAGVASPFLSDIDAAVKHLDPATIGRYFFVSGSAWGWIMLGSPIIILAIPDLLINAFFSGSWPWVVDLGWRYQLVIFSAFFVGTLETLPAITRFVQKRLGIANAERALITVLLTLTIMGLFRGGSLLHQLWSQVHRDWKKDVQCIDIVARSRGPVVADTYLCGYFSKKEQLWSSSLPGLPEAVFTDSLWYVGDKESEFLHPAVAHWDTVCSGARVFVLRMPHGTP